MRERLLEGVTESVSVNFFLYNVYKGTFLSDMKSSTVGQTVDISPAE